LANIRSEAGSSDQPQDLLNCLFAFRKVCVCIQAARFEVAHLRWHLAETRDLACWQTHSLARFEVALFRCHLAETRDLACWQTHSLARFEVALFRCHLAETRNLACWQTHSLARRACIFPLFSP
jgi:hypothetical protein